MTRAIFSLVTLAIVATLSSVLAPAPAVAKSGPIAEIICAQSDQMRRRLETQIGAQRIWSGLRNPDEVMELWEDRRGDWTLIIARANGNWCIVAMGTRLSPFSTQPHG